MLTGFVDCVLAESSLSDGDVFSFFFPLAELITGGLTSALAADSDLWLTVGVGIRGIFVTGSIFLPGGVTGLF